MAPFFLTGVENTESLYLILIVQIIRTSGGYKCILFFMNV
jgi:hypothetical protein